MAIVKVEKNSYTVESLYQWDLNQVLEIRGLSLPSIPEIHFTNEAMDRAIVRQASMDNAGIVRVNIPNSLLQKPYKITAYVCIYTGATFESLYKIEIPVKARTQPSDYTLTDDEEVYSFKALENAVNNALVACDTAEKNLAAATVNMKNAQDATTTALKNAENVLKQAVEDIDEKVATEVVAEVAETLPDFLDSTLKKTDKAAQAAAVGALATTLQTYIGKQATIVSGSYTGNGNYGESAPNTLNLGFRVKLLFIKGSFGHQTATSAAHTPTHPIFSNNSNGFTLIMGDGTALTLGVNGNSTWVNNHLSVTVTDTGISWFVKDEYPTTYSFQENKHYGQLNGSDVVYDYIAIG